MMRKEEKRGMNRATWKVAVEEGCTRGVEEGRILV
jgi:hypothetical protein